MCLENGQVMAVDVRRDLHAQYHVLVQSDDSRHCICYLDELESYTLCRNGKEQAGQPVVVGMAS